MARKLNKKGFTLVEIIVSLAIFSAVLAMLGGVMVTGFNYFYTTSQTDSNKRVADELIDYIRDELIYSTEVVIESENADKSWKKGDWKSFTVIDGQLHHFIENEDEASKDLNVFSESSFYNHNTFKLTAKAYEGNNRLDLQVLLIDEDETVYTTRDTLELVNVKSVRYEPFADELEIGKNGLKIYYRKGKTDVEDNGGGEEIPPITDGKNGTVGDLIYYINTANNRGLYDSSLHYSKGDMVYCDGSWWRRIYNQNDGLKPYLGNEAGWQKVQAEYVAGNVYLEDDVVTYVVPETGKTIYLQALEDIEKWQSSSAPQYYMINDNQPYKLWVGAESRDQLKPNNYNNSYDQAFSKNTILNKLLTRYPNFDFSDISASAITDVWNPTKEYKVGDFTKIEVEGTGYFRKYLKVFEPKSEFKNVIPGSTRESGWQLLEIDFNSNSSYVKDDIVVAQKGLWNGTKVNRFVYWVAKRGILSEDSRQEYIYQFGDGDNLESSMSNGIVGNGEDVDSGKMFWWNEINE